MATLDSSVVNIALPTLTKALETDLTQIKWVVMIYLLIVTGLLLPFGRMSDLYGRKHVIQMGFLVFLTGSILCGFSPSLGPLLVARLIQGIGAAMLMANGPAIITAHFPLSERGRALGTLAMVVSLGLISGPLVGGMLIEVLSWRSIFLLNIPICLLGLWLASKNMPSDRVHARLTHFDWAGSLLQMLFLLCFLILVDPPMISVSGSIPFFVPRPLIFLLAVAFGIVFVKVEQETKHPILDLSLLRIRTFWTANAASFMVFVWYSSVSILMPFFLEEVLLMPTSQVGLLLTAIPITVFVVAPISGRLADRIGSVWLRVAGTLVGATGLFFMSGIFGGGFLKARMAADQHAPISVIIGLCSMGLATGLFQSPNNTAIMSSVPTNKLGTASALLATIRNLGWAVGTGLAASLFMWRLETEADFVKALQTTFTLSGIVAVGAIVASIPWGRSRKESSTENPHS